MVPSTGGKKPRKVLKQYQICCLEGYLHRRLDEQLWGNQQSQGGDGGRKQRETTENQGESRLYRKEAWVTAWEGREEGKERVRAVSSLSMHAMMHYICDREKMGTANACALAGEKKIQFGTRVRGHPL